MIGRVLLWILLGLLALLLLLLLVPVTLYLAYEDGFITVKARLLFVRVRLFTTRPRPEKRKKPRKEKGPETPQPQEADKQEEPKPKRTFWETMDLIRRMMASARPALRFALRHIHVRAVRLVVVVHADNAADTAIAYGRAQAALGAVRAVAENAMDVRWQQLVLRPEFVEDDNPPPYFSCKIWAVPLIMGAVGIVFLREFSAWKKRRKANFIEYANIRRSEKNGQRRAPDQRVDGCDAGENQTDG